MVEDNLLNQELAKQLLAKNDIQISLAQNGEDAIEILQTADFDGILMDVQMPVMGGYATSREIRKKEQFRDLPIIAMTANVMAGDKKDASHAGMNDHIGKPFNTNEMLNTLARWITPSKQRRRSDYSNEKRSLA